MKKLLAIVLIIFILALTTATVSARFDQLDSLKISSDSSFLQWIKSIFSFNDKITGAASFTPQDCDNIYGSPGMVSYWTFDAGDATDDYDGNNGAVYGATSAAGQVNDALNFDGVDDYVDVDETNLKTLTQGTVSFWVKSVDVGTPVAISGTANTDYYVFVNNNNFGVRYKKAGVDIIQGNTNIPVGDNTWHHFVYTIDSSGNKIYVDGVQRSVTYTVGSASNTQFFGDSANWQYFTIGGVSYGSIPSFNADSLIDEVAIFDRALTLSEIQEQYDEGSVNHVGYCGEGSVCIDSDSDTICDDIDACNNNNPESNGLVGYWGFEETSGTNAADSYNGNPGTLVNMDDLDWVAGRVGNALDFDGSNDYVDLGNSTELQIIGDVTLSAWVKMDAVKDNADIIFFGTTGESLATNVLYSMRLDSNGGFADIRYTHEYGGGANQQNIFDTNLAVGEWYHLTITRDSTANEVKMYVNGQQVDSTYIYTDAPAGGTAGAAYIGINEAGGYEFDGLIDEAAIYNRVLNSTEILHNYAKGFSNHGYCEEYIMQCGNNFVDPEIGEQCDDGNLVSNDGCSATCQIEDEDEDGTFDNLDACYNPDEITGSMVGYWAFEDGEGESAADSYGGNPGTLVNMEPEDWVTGQVNGALDFSSNDYVMIDYNQNLSITGDLTLSAWINMDSIKNNADIIAFGGVGEGEAVNVLYAMRMLGDGDIKYLHEYGSGKNVVAIFDSNLTTGQWYHVAITRDTTYNQVRLYVNSQQIGETFTYDNNPTGGASGLSFIGANKLVSTSYYFDGIIDEVAIFDSALTPSQIQTQYVNGLSSEGYCVLPPCEDKDQDGYSMNGGGACCGATQDQICDVQVDCDDSRPSVNPAVSELCNGDDDNCNDQIDEIPACLICTDTDNDGYGVCPNCGVAKTCTYEGDDCNDGNLNVYPGAAEICNNGLDDNCDGSTDCYDEECVGTPECTPFCADADGDGYGDPGDASCPNGAATDCNDGNVLINPGAIEVCDLADNNCDGNVDEGLTCVFECSPIGLIESCGIDIGECQSGTKTCLEMPEGSIWGPCIGAVYPVAEVCDDGLDNNCNGAVDEGCPGCGDGIVDAGEECDDGNVVAGDGCSAVCEFEQSVDAAVCDANTPGMVSYWTFDNVNYPGTDDYNGNHGIVNGAISVAGKVNGALDLVASQDDYIDISSINDDFNADAGTVAVWVNLDTWAPATSNYIVDIRNSVENSVIILLSHSGADARWFYRGQGNNVYLDKPPSGATGWHHLAMTWDTTANQMKAYWDGAQYGSTQTGLTSWINQPDYAVIGNIFNPSGYTYGAVDGKLDEVAIYDRALTPTEIEEMYLNSNNYGKDYCEAFVSVCGDGIQTPDEQCDDGNVVAGDGCSAVCEYEKSLDAAICDAKFGTPGMVSYWTFDNLLNQGIDDYNGNDGTVVGAVTAAGKVNSALNFDGTNDYVDVGDITDFDFGSGDFAVSAWIKRDTIGRQQQIFGKDKASQRQFSLNLQADNTLFIYYSKDGASSGVYQKTLNTFTDTTEWYYVVGQKKGNSFEIYVNGVNQQLNTLTGTHGAMYAGAAKLLIGAREYAGYEEYFDGLMDEVAIYDRALNSDEITENYLNCQDYNKDYCEAFASVCGDGIITAGEECDDLNANSGDGCSNVCVVEPNWVCYGEPSICLPDSDDDGLEDEKDVCNNNNAEAADLVGYWALNELEGTTAYDSKNNNRGTITGGTYHNLAISNTGLYVDGTDNYVQVPDSSRLDITDEITVMAWVKYQSGAGDVIVNKNGAYGLSLTNGEWVFTFTDSATQTTMTCNSGIAPSISGYGYSNWYHLAVTYNRNAGECKFYVNRVLRQTTPHTEQIADGGIMRLGGWSGGTRFKGVLDDVAIYDKALTETQIQEAYENGIAEKSLCEPYTPQCGNGIIDVGEQCDDNNKASGDGCSSLCLRETRNTANCPSSLIDYWTLDGHGVDSVNIAHMTNIGADGTTGRVGGAMSFDGVNDHLMVVNQYLDMSTSRRSIAVWFKTTNTGDQQYMVSAGRGTTVQFSLGTDENGAVQFNSKNTYTSSYNNLIKTVNTFNDGQWHHAVATSTGTEYKIYVDGVDQQLIVASGANDGAITLSGQIILSAAIGGMGGSTGWPTYLFDGELDEAAIYSTEITQAEASAMYSNGLEGEGYCAPVTITHVFVDCDNGDDLTGDGSEQNPFGTIQHGIDSITGQNYQDWFEVTVLPGTCNEDVVMKRYVDVKGSGADQTTIIGPTANDPNKGSTVTMAYDTTISGFEITSDNPSFYQGGCVFMAGYAKVIENEIHGCNVGIWSPVAGSVIDDNYVHGITNALIQWSPHGDDNTKLTNNLLIGNAFGGAEGVNGCVISKNTIYTSNSDGVWVGGTGNIITDNIISTITGYGINAPAGNTVDYNLIYNTGSGYYTGTVVPGEHEITGLDPLFVNPSAGDFTLQPASPAAGTASDGENRGYDQTTEPIDTDGDTIPDIQDNCRYVQNTNQSDSDDSCLAYSTPYLNDPRCGDACEIGGQATWTTLISPEGIYEPQSASQLDGTHLHTFEIRFTGVDAIAGDVLSCDIITADSSILTVVSDPLPAMTSGTASIQYTIPTSDSSRIDKTQLWDIAECSQISADGKVYTHLNQWTRFDTANDDAYRALKCWAKFPNWYFANTVKCDFSGDLGFSIDMAKGLSVEGICDDGIDNEIGGGDGYIDCDDPDCWGISYNCQPKYVLCVTNGDCPPSQPNCVGGVCQ